MAVSVSQTAFAANNSYATISTTFTAVSFGAAASDREIFVSIFSSDIDGIGNFVASVTIGGVSASLIPLSEMSGHEFQLIWYWALVPLGSTGNIVVTLSNVPILTESTSISVYRVVGADQTTPVSAVATIAGGSGSLNPILNSITIPTGGAMVIATSQANNPAPTTLGFAVSTDDGGTTMAGWGGLTGALETGHYNVAGVLTTEQAGWSAGGFGFISGVAIQTPLPPPSSLSLGIIGMASAEW